MLFECRFQNTKHAELLAPTGALSHSGNDTHTAFEWCENAMAIDANGGRLPPIGETEILFARLNPDGTLKQNDLPNNSRWGSIHTASLGLDGRIYSPRTPDTSS
jgi:hypothetical protein